MSRFGTHYIAEDDFEFLTLDSISQGLGLQCRSMSSVGRCVFQSLPVRKNNGILVGPQIIVVSHKDIREVNRRGSKRLEAVSATFLGWAWRKLEMPFMDTFTEGLQLNFKLNITLFKATVR